MNYRCGEIYGQPGRVYADVAFERIRQDEKWGQQDHSPMEWLCILGEEVGEANKAVLEAHFPGYERRGDLSGYRAELVQVAAVAIAAIESLDRMTVILKGGPCAGWKVRISSFEAISGRLQIRLKVSESEPCDPMGRIFYRDVVYLFDKGKSESEAVYSEPRTTRNGR